MSNLLEQASLVMIPSGYKEDIVYSVIPTSGAGDLTFTRSSNGTRIDSNGNVEVVPWNLATNSENFTLWNLANVTVTANDLTAPNGTLTADKLTISNNANDVKQTISVMPNSVYTWTFYVYGGTALGQQGRFYDNTNGANIEYYSYSSSVVLGQWVKIERTFTTPSGCYEIQAWVLAATSTIGTMWAWGAQLNIGSTAKPYFPTTDRLNVPRLTYQNGGGGCPSLLLEKQSTNLQTYSEDFTQWASSNATVTANNTTSPDGTQNADRVQFTGAGYLLGTSQGSGTTYTISCWAKRNGSGTQSVGFFKDGSGVVDSAWALTSDWQRFTYTYTASNGSYSGIAGVNGGDVFVWGAQFEASSYPTSYIPTTSSSATRVADACYKTGISSLIGQTEGTLYWDGSAVQGNYNQLMFIKDSSANQFIGMTVGTGVIYGEIYNGGYVHLYSYSIGANDTSFKMALAYKTNDFAFYINGVQVGSSTTGTTPTSFDDFYLNNINNTRDLNCQVNEAIIFPTRLTNSELAQLTGNQNYTINQAYASYGVASESPNCVQP